MSMSSSSNENQPEKENSLRVSSSTLKVTSELELPIVPGPAPGQLPLRSLFLGQLGSGKTAAACYLASSERRIVTIDSFRDATLGKMGVMVFDAHTCLDLMDNDRHRVVYRGPLTDADLIVSYPLAVNENRDLHGGEQKPFTIFVDELWAYCRPGRMSDTWLYALKMSRQRSLKLIATSQRPGDLDKNWLSDCELYLGRIQEANDARYLRGLNSVPREMIEAAMRLPPPTVTDGKLILHFVRPLVYRDVCFFSVPLSK